MTGRNSAPDPGTPAAGVARRVEAEYAPRDHAAIRRRLVEAAADSPGLQLAILDLAGGRRRELEDWCAIARVDPRDVWFAHRRWCERRPPL